MRERHVLWTPVDEPGFEHLHLRVDSDRIVADGRLLAVFDEIPLHVRYRVVCDTRWAVREVVIEVEGEPARRLDLRADGAGRWFHAPSEPLADLAGCLDVDIAVTPFTNTLPIRRLALAPGASADIRVAYVRVPQLSVEPARQRYGCLERTRHGARYAYEGLDTGFAAEVTVDEDGLVVDYASVFRRVWSA